MLDADCEGVKFRTSANLPKKTVIVVDLGCWDFGLENQIQILASGRQLYCDGACRANRQEPMRSN